MRCLLDFGKGPLHSEMDVYVRVKEEVGAIVCADVQIWGGAIKSSQTDDLFGYFRLLIFMDSSESSGINEGTHMRRLEKRGSSSMAASQGP